MGSVSVDDEGKEKVKVKEHIRERNWNSPQPKWRPSPTHRRSVSPILPNPGPVATSTPAPTGRYVNGSGSVREKEKSRSRLSSFGESPVPVRGVTSKEKTKAKAMEDSPSANGKSPSISKSLSVKPVVDESPSRSASPQPPSDALPNGHAGGSKMSNFKSRFGWQFPQTHGKPSLPSLDKGEDEEARDPEDNPPPRSPSPVRALSSRIPTAIHMKSSDNEKEKSEKSVQRKRGHKRNETELAEAVGRIPPRIKVQMEEEARELAARHEEVQGDNQEVLAAANTPIAKPIQLPLDPPRPASPPPTSNRDASLSPKTFPTPDSPPPSPPSNKSTSTHSRPISFVLQTPPRKSHSPKLEYKTPSPPRNMPELPGPPATSDEDNDDDRTPINTNRSNELLVNPNFTAMKTPKPPGAWATTPGPSERDLIVRPSSTPPYTHQTPSPLASTPAPAHGFRAVTLSRAESLPNQLKTPAPPGAWLTTPGTSARRKSILKVRFDVEPGELSSDMSMLETTGTKLTNGSAKPREDSPLANAKAKPKVKEESNSAFQPTATSSPQPGKPARESPKSPSVRLVDAFGNETTMDESLPTPVPPEVTKEELPKPKAVSMMTSRPPELPRPPQTPRSKSAIRIVDALGREVVEVKEDVRGVKPEDDTEEFAPLLTHNEALARVRETIVDLANDLDEVDKYVIPAIYVCQAKVGLCFLGLTMI